MVAPAAATPIVVTVGVISGLLALQIVILCCVAVFGSEAHSTRAIKALALLTGRPDPEPPEGGETRSNS
jgi:hypothetical protein